MIKRFVLFLIISIFLLINTNVALAQLRGGVSCKMDNDQCDHSRDLYCLPDKDNPSDIYCQYDPFKSVFGKIQTPDALKHLVGKDPTGAGGIGIFLSNLIALFYSIAGVVLILMLVWGAFDWLTSGGEKEKIQSAQKKIINTIIGIVLFAVAFAVIQILGHFTGFTFFAGQKP